MMTTTAVAVKPADVTERDTQGAAVRTEMPIEPFAPDAVGQGVVTVLNAGRVACAVADRAVSSGGAGSRLASLRTRLAAEISEFSADGHAGILMRPTRLIFYRLISMHYVPKT